MDCEHVVDMAAAVFLAPAATGFVGILNDRAHVGMGEQIGGGNHGVGLARQRDVVERPPARRRPRHEIGGVCIFGQMRIVPAQPFELAKIDAVLVLQDAAHPDAGGLRIGAHGDLLAFKRFGVHRRALFAADEELMLETANHGGGQQNQRLSVIERLHIGDDGQLARVKLALAHHRLEALVGGGGAAEVEQGEV